MHEAAGIAKKIREVAAAMVATARIAAVAQIDPQNSLDSANVTPIWNTLPWAHTRLPIVRISIGSSDFAKITAEAIATPIEM